MGSSAVLSSSVCRGGFLWLGAVVSLGEAGRLLLFRAEAVSRITVGVEKRQLISVFQMGYRWASRPLRYFPGGHIVNSMFAQFEKRDDSERFKKANLITKGSHRNQAPCRAPWVLFFFFFFGSFSMTGASQVASASGALSVRTECLIRNKPRWHLI